MVGSCSIDCIGVAAAAAGSTTGLLTPRRAVISKAGMTLSRNWLLLALTATKLCRIRPASSSDVYCGVCAAAKCCCQLQSLRKRCLNHSTEKSLIGSKARACFCNWCRFFLLTHSLQHLLFTLCLHFVLHIRLWRILCHWVYGVFVRSFFELFFHFQSVSETFLFHCLEEALPVVERATLHISAFFQGQLACLPLAVPCA